MDLNALEEHRESLRRRVRPLEGLIQTVEVTFQHLIGENTMSTKSLFEGISEEERARYAKEAERMYHPETVRESNCKGQGYAAEKKHLR